jgi:hypothetical protein
MGFVSGNICITTDSNHMKFQIFAQIFCLCFSAVFAHLFSFLLNYIFITLKNFNFGFIFLNFFVLFQLSLPSARGADRPSFSPCCSNIIPSAKGAGIVQVYLNLA